MRHSAGQTAAENRGGMTPVIRKGGHRALGEPHAPVRPDVAVKVHGIRLGGVRDDGPGEPGGPTVRVDARGLLDGVTVTRG